MIGNKLRVAKFMLMSKKMILNQQSIVKTCVPARTMYPQISSNVVCGPPRNRISFGEKIATGVFLASCILFTPAWVMYHFDCYRVLPGQETGEDEDEE